MASLSKMWKSLLCGVLGSVIAVPLLRDYNEARYAEWRKRFVPMKSVRGCKEILQALQQYSNGSGGAYLDGKQTGSKSANDVFRELFRAGMLDDERRFGSAASEFDPDNEMGSPPSFHKTLEPGECHWMLLKHQNRASHPKTPLVIENSLHPSWPPRWDAALWGRDQRGRAWSDGTIIVGRNDGSVQIEKLRPDGTLDWHSAPNLDEHGKSWIDYLTPEQIAKLEYWDVEEKKP